MKISIPLLRQLLVEARFYGFEGNEEFDRLNIAHLKDFEIQTANTVLYFAVYEDHPEKEGWYNDSFDRTKNIESLQKLGGHSFVIDRRVSIDQYDGLQCIVVEDIFVAIATIRSYVLSQCNPIVIGITGSVGKTTAAAMMEHVIEKSYRCKRIYSKRLTPLTLTSWIINYLEKDDEIIVLEYSMYRPHHIEELVKILPPYYGVFLNVKKMHLGVRGINTLEDIVASKEALTKASTISILNADDSFVMKSRTQDKYLFSVSDKNADCSIVKFSPQVEIVCLGENIRFNPYIQTELFLHQALASCVIARALLIPSKTISEALDRFMPEENRIMWVTHNHQKILFDGDVTISARLKALAENSYSKTLLVIINFDFGEENVELQVDDFNDVFSSFSQVRVINNDLNRELVNLHQFKNISFIDSFNQNSDLKLFDFVVVHYGIYFRMFKDITHLQMLLE